MYIYLWVEACGWSYDEPTPEDRRSMEHGNLTVVQIRRGFIPFIVGSGEMVQCKIEHTPEGEPYHYVP